MSGQGSGDATRSLIRPPQRRSRDREAPASRLELFFDLAYVLVVLELAATFLHDPSWHGLGIFAGLFTTMWFSWVGFTLYANRFDTDDVIFRVAKLLATLTVAGCAASAAEATGSLSIQFAASYLANAVILVGLYLRAWRHIPDARPTIGVYLGCTGLAACWWAASIPVGVPMRFVLWGLGVATVAAGPLLASLRSDTVALHLEHLPERFALLVILVLGESVGGAATGVYHAHWSGPAIAVGVTGFAVAAGMWWIHFDVTASVAAQTLAAADDEDAAPATGAADERHDAFIYGHLPLTLGIVMTGVGIEDLVLHTDAALPSPGGWILAGGLALFIAGAALVVGGTTRHWRMLWPWPTAAIPAALVVALIPHHSALLLVGAMAAISLGLAVHGTVRNRRV